MPDIALRFNKDMLVLSAPIQNTLARQGVDVDADLEYQLLMEPEAVHDALQLELSAGAQCLVVPTAGFTTARLAHKRMEDKAADLAHAACEQANAVKPQHILVEIGPCGLPLDPSSKASLNEHRAQYAAAGRAFQGETFDAFFLNGFANLDDLQTALMGLAQVSDMPVFASVDVDAEGLLPDGRTIEDAAALMQEYGAKVAGFVTALSPKPAAALAKRAAGACGLPLLVQLDVREVKPRQFEATEQNPYYRPDEMVSAAAHLHAAGVQFVRAVGAATASYTGALAATTGGLDVLASAAVDEDGE